MKNSWTTASSPLSLYRTRILPVVFYGCGTWSLTLREEYRLRVSKNKVLRKMLGHKRDKVTGKWRRLHNEELYDCTPHKMIQMIKRRANGICEGFRANYGQSETSNFACTQHASSLTFTSVTTLEHMCNNRLSLRAFSGHPLRKRDLCLSQMKPCNHLLSFSAL